jgi:DNA polymerase-1
VAEPIPPFLLMPETPIGPPPHPTLFLIDGYALIYRAFFALLSRPLRTAKGENTSAAWGVVTFLQRLLAKHQPDYVGWVHDAGSSFRKEVFPDYKATREKLSDELQADFDQGLDRIEELLAGFRVPILAVDGYEADDVIGTLASQGVQQGLEVVIVSGDKDFQQLVSPGVWLLNPGRGGPAAVDEQWVGVANGSERLGVAPEFVTDYLAMVGDSSDNVPGVKGIGGKTAVELVSTYGDLEAILAHAQEVTKKRPREALQEYADLARLSKQLVTIRDDVPIALQLDSLRRQAPDADVLRRLYVELEFTSLLKTLPTEETSSVPSERAVVTSPVVVVDVEQVKTMVEAVRSAGQFILATQTQEHAASGNRVDPLTTQLTALACAIPDGDVYYLPLAHRAWAPPQGELLLGRAAEVERAVPEGDSAAARAIAQSKGAVRNLPGLMDREMSVLRDLLADESIPKSGHHLKFDVMVLRSAGVQLQGLGFDAMLASYVLDPGRRSHELDVLSQEFANQALASWDSLVGTAKKAVAFDEVPVEVAATFAAERLRSISALQTIMSPQLVSTGMDTLLKTIELDLVPVLADMEWTGVSVDVTYLNSLKIRFERAREELEEHIYEEAGDRFNINSNPQLRVILFEKLNLPVKKKTATGPSTDASVLQELAEEGHRLPGLLMEYREIAKLENTYLDTLPGQILARDRRIHTTYNQTVAATGRLSSTDPNLQNIPIRSELGRQIREAFVPAEGFRFIAADYSQIELRLLAHLSGDEAFVRAFKAGEDIHRQTAAIIFGVDLADVTSEMRGRAKTINFATIYGQGAHALSRQLGISNQEAKDFIATYFERFHGVRDYLDRMVQLAKQEGYVETIFHRRRYIPELKERNFNVRAFGERVATNAPIQGSAADLIKLAMIRIHAVLATQFPAARMILQVHDELVFEVPTGLVQQVSEVVKREMEGAAQLSVPLIADLGVGANWMAAKG